MSADYSQVELRLLAHIAGEDVLKEIFRRGEDVHTATACRVFNVTPDQIDPGMRSKSKMINYGIVYGLSAYGMADRLDIPQEEADEFIQRYLAGFPAVERFIEETIEQGTEHGLRLDPVRPPPPGARAARPALGPAQAGRALRGQHGDPGDRRGHHEGGDGPLRPARWPRPGSHSRLVLQIHDELLFEGPADEAEQVKAIAVREMAGGLRDGSAAGGRGRHRHATG